MDLPIHEGVMPRDALKPLIERAMEMTNGMAHDRSGNTLLRRVGKHNYLVEPEYFGRLTANLRGWGAVCWPNAILRAVAL